MLLLQFFVSGVVTGCFLILATIGFSLTRRVEGFLNIAHAELLGVSAFATWWLNAHHGWHVLVAAVAAVAFTALVGLGIARVVYDPIRHRGPAVLLITSTGVAFVIGGALHGLIGTGIRPSTSASRTDMRPSGCVSPATSSSSLAWPRRYRCRWLCS